MGQKIGGADAAYDAAVEPGINPHTATKQLSLIARGLDTQGRPIS
jgi:hypothetical protein